MFSQSSIFKKVACLLSVVTVCYTHALQVKQQAPAFCLFDSQGRTIQLSDLRGARVALVFYPRDGVAGRVFKALEHHKNELEAAGIIVLGLSSNSPADHNKYKIENNITFIELLTVNEDTLKAYNAAGAIMNKWKTVLVDEQGEIVCVIDNVESDNHAAQILRGFGVIS